MQGFQLQVRRLLITFPQVGPVPQGGTLEELMGYHLAFLPKMLYYVCCQEKHEDGGIHYHLVLVFAEKYYTRDPRSFDWMFDKHGDCKPIKAGSKNMARAIAYVKKDDNWVEDGNAPVDPPKVATMQRISKLILEGKSFEDIETVEHAAMIMHDMKVMRSVERRDDRLPSESKWVPPVFSSSLQQGSPQDAAVMLIKIWLNENIRKERDYRAPHLWIWGSGKIGKTRLMSQLSTMLKVFVAPSEGKEWLTGYRDSYDLVVFDDYNHSKSVTFLKQLLQAFPMKVGQKSLPPYFKKKNMPFLFTSNKKPEDAYRIVSVEDPQHFIPLLERLIVVNVTEFNLFP